MAVRFANGSNSSAFDKSFVTKKLQTKLSLTKDDTKILGHTIEKRRQKTALPTQYPGRNLKTLNSSWTPIVHKPSNQQIFKERCNLISHWFDLWTDNQRKQFLQVILDRCERPQHKFVHDWFQERVPLQHLDFTSVLPRFISLYILSFLEPRYLCRAAQVCWHWKFLSEQDTLWERRCVKFGWFLPYSPEEGELGAWKRHYVACVSTMDYGVVSDEYNELYGSRGGGLTGRVKRVKTREHHQRLTPAISRYVMDAREPWQGPDFTPRDLESTHRAFLHEFNPNDPRRPSSSTIAHDRWGIVKKPTIDVSRSLDSATLGLGSSCRKQRHHMKGDNRDSLRSQRINLSQSMDLENFAERRLRELVEQPYGWERGTGSANRRPGTLTHPSTQKLTPARPDETPTLHATDPHPRVIFISSRVPAAEMLVDAVSFGVIPIVYEYEGETTTSLLQRMYTVLNGRIAQSLGVFGHTDAPGHIALVHDTPISLQTLDHPDIREFFEVASSHIVPQTDGGQFDVFMPLAASEDGTEMLMQLQMLTGVVFSSPTGIIGSYNHINTQWSHSYPTGSPSHMYFCEDKLNVWTALADQVTEASSACMTVVGAYLTHSRRDMAAQLTGQILFDSVGLTNIHRNPKIALSITDALADLAAEPNCLNPVEFLGRRLLQMAGVSDQSGPVLTSHDTYEEVDQELAQINRKSIDNKDESSEDKGKTDEDGQDEINEEIDGEYSGENFEDASDSDNSEKKDVGKQDSTGNIPESLRGKPANSMNSLTTRRLNRLTAQQYADHPEKRTPIAREVLASESEYTALLDAVRSVYVKPLQAAVNSNRAIVSSHNISTIFSDILEMLTMSRTLTEDLTRRLSQWDPQHTCLGDLFLKLCTRLKVYTNFLNNYTIILDAVEKCKDQSPPFRSFLRRHDRVPRTKMMTLQELLVLPTRRIAEYVTLLTWFKTHTPRNHADHADLHSAISALRDLDLYIAECRERVERDRQMVVLQKTILNCPSLLEANRFLVKHVDVAYLKPPDRDSIVPELRVYQQTGVLGLYLFSDALVLTNRTKRHYPFSRAHHYCYQFDASVGLTRLRVKEIPNSKYIQNAFKIMTPKRAWHCSVATADEKFSWIAVLEKATKSAVEG